MALTQAMVFKRWISILFLLQTSNVHCTYCQAQKAYCTLIVLAAHRSNHDHPNTCISMLSKRDTISTYPNNNSYKVLHTFYERTVLNTRSHLHVKDWAHEILFGLHYYLNENIQSFQLEVQNTKTCVIGVCRIWDVKSLQQRSSANKVRDWATDNVKDGAADTLKTWWIQIVKSLTNIS